MTKRPVTAAKMKENISNEKIALTNAGNDDVSWVIFFCFFLSLFSCFVSRCFSFLHLAIRREVELILGDGTDNETDLKSILPSNDSER